MAAAVAAGSVDAGVAAGAAGAAAVVTLGSNCYCWSNLVETELLTWKVAISLAVAAVAAGVAAAVVAAAVAAAVAHIKPLAVVAAAADP